MTLSLGVSLVTGVCLGALAAGAHLAVVRVRAGLVVAHKSAAAWALYPVGLLGPALAVLAAAHLDPRSAWTAPLGILLLRSAVLRHVARRP